MQHFWYLTKLENMLQIFNFLSSSFMKIAIKIGINLKRGDFHLLPINLRSCQIQ